MRIGYLVFAYMNPALLGRVIEYLSCQEASFYVHIDAKIPIEQFESIRGERVFISEERLPVHWAEFSGVRAILLLIRKALAASPPHDYFVLLSGSEFPLRSRRYIHKFFERHRGQEFITMQKMPAPGKPISRLNTKRYPSSRPALRLLYRALAKVGLAQRDYRKYLGSLQPYSGVTWWALSRDACQYIIDFTDSSPALANFCETLHAPEETYIHTILGNSPFKTRVRRNLVYEDWPADGKRTHPMRINARHLDFFASRDEVSVTDLHGPGELLFARKFSDADLELTERIAAINEEKEKYQSSCHGSNRPCC